MFIYHLKQDENSPKAIFLVIPFERAVKEHQLVPRFSLKHLKKQK